MKHIPIKTKRMLEVEEEYHEPIEELLRRLYVDEDKTLTEISEEIRVSYRIILQWVLLAGIYSKNLKVGE